MQGRSIAFWTAAATRHGRVMSETDPSIPVPDPWRRGRGVAGNPANRFEGLAQVWDDDFDPATDPDPKTVFLDDDTQSILSKNDSSDVPFTVGVNPYRGCEHGCSYCYARTYHEHLGMSAGLDFETKIMVKRRAPALLRAALSAPSWRPRPIGMSGATDCYQPVERRLRLTRGCLEVLAEFANPLHLITKNALVVRDADLLARLAADRCVGVAISLTSLRPELSRVMEPRASDPAARLEAVRRLSAAGIPVGVNLAPIIPGLTDEELPAMLRAAAEAGAKHASYQVVRLPLGVGDIFANWIRHHFPTRAEVVLERIASLHGGQVDAAPGRRNPGSGAWAEQIAQLFRLGVRRNQLDAPWPELSMTAFRPPGGKQQTIW